ncbi:hypothetical protein [Loigolactobacillus binensis]|uniref:Uncharacterized protein n=1 Tax=Loigolactobacillus binensis TaxID=2559922 RepID=A0ABW3EDT9_9LACO|nr:hypothetical protein [Loigolactobacillus binensis]
MQLKSIIAALPLWGTQLMVAIFFIAGFVNTYMEMWARAFREPQRSAHNRLLHRVLLLVTSIGIGGLLNGMGYFSNQSAMLYHNMGIFILVLALLDEDTNLLEYLLRCVALVVVWLLYFINDFTNLSFVISLTVLVVTLINIRIFRTQIGPHFPQRLIVAVIIAADFWLNLPTHTGGMKTSPEVALGAIIMFFVMKLSTGRQQRRFFANLATAHQANFDELTNTKNFTAYQKDIFTFFGSTRIRQQPLSMAVVALLIILKSLTTNLVIWPAIRS